MWNEEALGELRNRQLLDLERQASEQSPGRSMAPSPSDIPGGGMSTQLHALLYADTHPVSHAQAVPSVKWGPFTPREEQVKVVEEAISALEIGSNVLLDAPTASGKTLMAAKICSDLLTGRARLSVNKLL